MSTSISSNAAEPIQIKGFAVRGLLKYVKRHAREGGIGALLADLPAADAALFDQRVLSSAWYPYATFTVLLEAIDRKLGTGDLSYLARVGESSGREDAGTIFKVVLTLASIERVIAIAPPFWKRYCNRGWFEPMSVSPGHLEIRLHRFPDIHPGHCRLIAGWIKGLGLTAGASEARVEEVACVHRGDSFCEFNATWS